MIDDCHRYLAPLPGIVFYAAGTPTDADRSSGDADFDVALHVVFADQAAFDAYMMAPRHVEFMEKYEANWKDVRALDSCVASGS